MIKVLRMIECGTCWNEFVYLNLEIWFTDIEHVISMKRINEERHFSSLFICKHILWQTGKTQMKSRIMWHFIRTSTLGQPLSQWLTTIKNAKRIRGLMDRHVQTTKYMIEKTNALVSYSKIAEKQIEQWLSTHQSYIWSYRTWLKASKPNSIIKANHWLAKNISIINNDWTVRQSRSIRFLMRFAQNFISKSISYTQCWLTIIHK